MREGDGKACVRAMEKVGTKEGEKCLPDLALGSVTEVFRGQFTGFNEKYSASTYYIMTL
jgi:hypothetical protein